jgi:acetate kinase
MNVLVFNCGSSSVKFQLIAVDRDGTGPDGTRRLLRGAVERIGEGAAVEFHGEGRASHRSDAAIADHGAAVEEVIEWVGRARVDAVGHRVVHGGERLTAPTRVDEAVIRSIEALEDLAPLHNAPSLAGIRACRGRLGPAVPMVAVFDTAFHAGLPARAHRYAIPWELGERHGVRRFGFHGIAYASVLARYGELTGRPAGEATVVALHLGNGCSAAAIRGGRSVDTSMGFTPLEGLVMGTRSGDLDPAVIGYLARKEGVPVGDVERCLNERAGLLGVSGRSRDMRELLRREAGDPRARLAVELFCYRARKYVGAYLAALGGAQAILFSGGIGERSPEVRARICEDMQWCGLALDPAGNAEAVGVERRIDRPDAALQAWVIPADEELVIARDTVACLGRER